MNFISCGSFELKSLEASSKGRPEYSFSVSPKIFSAFFYQSLSRADIIFINAYSDVVGRYEYMFDKNISSKENFQKALSIILDNENYGNCTSVYVTCQDKFKSLVPNSFNFTNEREMIMDSYINNDEVIVFKFGRDLYLSLYGRISTLPTKIEDIEKVVNIDKVYSFKKDDIMVEMINSLQYITIKNMIKRIQK